MGRNAKAASNTMPAKDQPLNTIQDAGVQVWQAPLMTVPAVTVLRNVSSAAIEHERPARLNAANFPTPERVSDIIGVSNDPVLRNLLITQCYHDLSAGIAELLTGGNANWCTFATWASKTA